MKKLKHNEMRKMWFEFWKSKGHEIVPSSSLIPHNDPSLLWVNAGITPLKKYFDGTLIPSNDRLASCQKCIRTNDIDNVGKTAHHATFFEMLGNFSIGDYFKKEAINWAWEFLTSEQWLNIDSNKLYVTIYPADKESYDIWSQLVSEDKIIKLEDNYWEIGPGPSGPCSEIFYDRGIEFDPNNIGIKLLKEEIDNERYIEIWNNVFSMYNASEYLTREEYSLLPSKNIDTGMGLERILTLSQKVKTIFDTDLFVPIIKRIEEITKKPYNNEMPFKVIAEHTRAVVFALADGADFGNSGRDYVLRRLLRRALRYGRKLNINEPFLYLLVATIIETMKEPYPYLIEFENDIMLKIRKEEELFYCTLIAGEKKLNQLLESPLKIISGNEAFKLYDTYGFPLELTIEFAKENGYKVDIEGFHLSMKKQQELARSARLEAYSMNMQNEALLNFKEESEFTGFDNLNLETKIIALFDGKKFVSELTNEGYIVLEKTPFYAESGGQISDSGTLIINNQTIEVLDLFKGPNYQHFHHVKFEGIIKLKEKVKAKVDNIKRSKITKNHSAAHLLHKALKDLFGSKVKQAGSRIDEFTLRFDFTYDKKINDNEIIKIEELVNSKIQTKTPVKIETLKLDEAIKKGAEALFEEKYEENVRVVYLADSIELCGGTHVTNVGEIEKFAIKSLETKGNNNYRIEAATSSNIRLEMFKTIKPYNDSMITLLQKAKKIVEDAHKEGIQLNFNFDIDHEPPLNYKDVIFNRKELASIKKEVQELEKKYLVELKKQSLNNLEPFESKLEIINNINTIIVKVENYKLEVLKEIVNSLSNKYKNSLIFIANIVNNNVNYIARSSKTLEDKINLGLIVKEISVKSMGSGGGSKTYAQGGGTSILNVEFYLKLLKDIVKKS